MPESFLTPNSSHAVPSASTMTRVSEAQKKYSMVRMWGQQSSDVSGTQEEQNIGHDQSVQAQTGTMLRPISVSETKIAGDKTQCPDACI
eukprot:scaffold73468_cov18-Tisochrysis_lutea.AAC.1